MGYFTGTVIIYFNAIYKIPELKIRYLYKFYDSEKLVVSFKAKKKNQVA